MVGNVDDGMAGEELFERRVVALKGIGVADVRCVAFPPATALLYCAVAFGDIADVRFVFHGASGQIVYIGTWITVIGKTGDAKGSIVD